MITSVPGDYRLQQDPAAWLNLREAALLRRDSIMCLA